MRGVVKVVSLQGQSAEAVQTILDSFRRCVYDCACRFPEDVVEVMTEWHRLHGGIIPWLRALGGEGNLAEADRLEAEAIAHHAAEFTRAKEDL